MSLERVPAPQVPDIQHVIRRLAIDGDGQYAAFNAWWQQEGNLLDLSTQGKQNAALAVVREIETADLLGTPVVPFIHNLARELIPLLRQQGIEPFPQEKNASSE